MSDNDSLQRFIFDDAPVRGEFIQLQDSLQAILHQHPYPRSLRRLLSEALCVAVLLGAIIKFSGRFTVQFRGKGKLKLLLAQCDNQFHLRGLAKWEGDLTQEDLMEALTQGVLVIMLDTGLTKGNYQGIVSWRGNSLATSIEGYFAESEQLATKIWLAVDDEKAAGLLLQIVPGAEKEDVNLDQHATQAHWDRILQMTSQLQPSDMLHSDYQSLLYKLYPQEEIRIFPAVTASFRCTCSRKKGEDAILLLGQEEAEAEIKDKQSIVVTCDFCNKEYLFDRADVAKIFMDKNNEPPPSIH